MNRYVIAAGVGSLVFAAAVGSASALDVNAGVAQTGVGELGGDPDGVRVVSYKTESDTGESYGVRVGGINDVPAGSEMFAVIYDGSGNKLKDSGGVIYDGSGNASFTWRGGPQDIEQIESLRLTFESGD